jgi:hypothetical protein
MLPCSADVTNQIIVTACTDTCVRAGCDLDEAKHASGQAQRKASNAPYLPPVAGV